MEILIDRLHEERDGLKCELTINSSRPPSPGLLREGRFNLSSPTTRSSWVKDLNQREAEIDWYAVLETVCARSTRRWRQGEPMVDLADVDVPDELPYLAYPLLVDGACTVLFADGASGKSLLALAMAVSVATGEEIIPGVLPMRTGPVIYWDWEWDAESHAERLQAVCAGAKIDVPHGMIFYQREMASVLEAAPRMRKRVAETGAVFIVADSLGFARGGEPNSADLTTRMFTQLRTLSVPVLALDHLDKNSIKEGKAEASFGSIYTRNSARMMWRIDSQKEEGKDNFYAALVNTKANRKEQRTRGLDIRLTSDADERLTSVEFFDTDVKDIPGLNRTLSLRDRLAQIILTNRRAMPLSDLVACLEAEGIATTSNVVGVTLSRNKKTFVNTRDGWGLLEIREPINSAN